MAVNHSTMDGASVDETVQFIILDGFLVRQYWGKKGEDTWKTYLKIY
ncbi:hypothetical protein [Bacillus timonensis]|nr:hypothetical protein [Bacillus timonensis]